VDGAMNSKLTKQELVVFQLLVDYAGEYKPIAEQLTISDYTVKTHIQSIFQKLYANH
jgi:DNA-binding NarL/FixJ family response regulator